MKKISYPHYEGKHAEFADRMMERGAIMLKGPAHPEGFRLKLHETEPNEPLSPIYLNLRDEHNPNPGPLIESDFALAAELMQDEIHRLGLRMDAICPLPRAGDPFAQALLEQLSPQPMGLITLHKQVFDDGTRRITRVDSFGGVEPGSIVLVLDDLVTKANTKFEGLGVLADAGYIVKVLLVMVDRLGGGAAELAKAGYTLHAIFTLTGLLDHYTAIGRITPAVRQEVLTYLKIAA